MFNGRFRTSVIAGLIAMAASATLSSAGFILGETRTSVSATRDRIDLFALNTGGETGTRFNAVSFNSLFVLGGKSYWGIDDTDEDGVADTLDILNATARTDVSYIRPNPASSANFVFGPVPYAGYRQPNAWTNGVHTMAVDIFSAGPGAPASTGNGYRFARFFVDKGAQVVARGLLGGDVGSSVPFSHNIGTSGAAPVVSVPGTSEHSPILLDLRVSSSFDIPVSATDSDGTVLDITMSVPNLRFVDNIVYPDEPSASKVFRVVGLDASDLVAPYTNYLWYIDFTAIDNSGRVGTKRSYLYLIAPEPATAMGLAMGSTALGRRRKRVEPN